MDPDTGDTVAVAMMWLTLMVAASSALAVHGQALVLLGLVHRKRLQQAREVS